MSDDEDDPSPIPGQAQQYITRRPWYRSDEVRITHILYVQSLTALQLHNLYVAVDGLPDPDPDAAKKMNTRVVMADDKKGGEPVRARMLKTRLRAWMIKPEVLAANPHWFRSGRVAPNGKAWGDAEDPVEELSTAARGKASKSVKFRRMEDTADVQAAREKFNQSTLR